MNRAHPILALTVLAALLARPPLARAQNEGLGELDQATELQMSARSLGDLQRVIQLCEGALAKGLDEDNAKFARELLSSVLYQRAENLSEAIANAPTLAQRVKLLQAALADLQKAVENQPAFGAAYYLAAKMHVLSGDRKKALESINQAVEHLQDNNQERSKSLVLRAQLLEDDEKRLADYDEAVRLDPGNSDAWEQRAMLYLDRGEPDKASEQFQKLLEQDGKNAVALHGAAEALMQMEKYDEALKYIDEAIAIDPRSPLGYLSKARIHGMMDKADEAIKDLGEALKHGPGNLSALLLRARLYEATGDRKSALADVEQALQQRPRLPQALLLRSMFAAADGKFSAAIADIQVLLRDDPKNVEWQLQLASYYNADKRPRRAIDIYSAILKEDPDEWQAMRGRADALLSVGKHAEAIQDYDLALKLQPENSGILNNLAWVLATSPEDSLRSGTRAIELATKACEVTEYKQAHILSTLAAAYAETGDFDTAAKWSSKAVELGEEDLKQQLGEELKSYQEKKPWRELQNIEESGAP